MGKLHELLAVEPDLEGVSKKVVEEATVTFSKKTEHFLGMTKVLKMIDESAPENDLTEQRELVTTVDEKLAYVGEHLAKYLDVVLQKEATNQIAKADLVVDGVTLAKDLPATFLLGMETKLKNLRAMYEVIPTLQPGVAWIPSTTERKGVFTTKDPDVKLKTAKTFQHKVLYDATDKHPAQIEKWEEQKPVGRFITTMQCGMLSPARKSIILGRIDTLIQAVKKARQRANAVDVVEKNIGDALVKFINKD